MRSKSQSVLKLSLCKKAKQERDPFTDNRSNFCHKVVLPTFVPILAAKKIDYIDNIDNID